MEQVVQVGVALMVQAAGWLARSVGMARAADFPGQVEVPGAVVDTVAANVKQVDWRPVMLDCDDNVCNSQLDLS